MMDDRDTMPADDDELPDLDDLRAQQADIEKYVALGPFEYAAEQMSGIFDRLSDDDKRALTVRMLALGALHAGDLRFIDKVGDEARAVVTTFLQAKAWH